MAKKFTLVLSGGGAKGYVHIGVIKVLEENGIVPDFIIGTSMGALIGAAYAMGMTADELVNVSKTIRRRDLADLNLLALFHKNVFLGKKVDNFLQKTFGDTDAKKTKIPFACVACCLDSGKTYVLDKGPLWKNVRASMGVPIVFPEVEIDGVMMCDGGCTNNLPDNLAREREPDSIIMGVDCMYPYVPYESKFGMVESIINVTNLFQAVASVNRPPCDDLRINVSSNISNLSFEKKAAIKAIGIGRRAMNKNLKTLAKLLEIKLPPKKKKQ